MKKKKGNFLKVVLFSVALLILVFFFYIRVDTTGVGEQDKLPNAPVLYNVLKTSRGVIAHHIAGRNTALTGYTYHVEGYIVGFVYLKKNGLVPQVIVTEFQKLAPIHRNSIEGYLSLRDVHMSPYSKIVEKDTLIIEGKNEHKETYLAVIKGKDVDKLKWLTTKLSGWPSIKAQGKGYYLPNSSYEIFQIDSYEILGGGNYGVYINQLLQEYDSTHK